MKNLLVVLALFVAVRVHADVVRLNVNDMIHPISEEFIERGLTQAASEHAEAVVIELTTPGGLLDSTRSIVEKLMTSSVPVIVFVGPAGARAASAGFFILHGGGGAPLAPGHKNPAPPPAARGGGKKAEGCKHKNGESASALTRARPSD